MTRLERIAAAIQVCTDRKKIKRLNLLWWREFFRVTAPRKQEAA